jgi:hypothetical protein
MSAQRPEPKETLRFGIAPAGVALTTLLVQLPFHALWFNFMDEGHMVQFADMVLRGGEFYRDATFYPLPGSFWFLTLVFEIFGPSILVSRWVVMFQFTIFVTLIFLLQRRITSLPYALIGVGCMLLYRVWCFPHWHIYSYSTSSLLMLVAAMLVLVRFFEAGHRRTLAFAGLLFGMGVACKQDYGAAGFVAMLLALCGFAFSGPRASRQSIGALLVWFFVPAGLVGATIGLYYWRVGILDELLRFTVFNHFVGMSSYEYLGFPYFHASFGQDPAFRTKLGLTSYMPGILFTTDWAVVRSHALFTDTVFYDVLLKAYLWGPQLFLTGAWARLLWLRGDLASDGDPVRRQRFLAELVMVAFGSTLITLVWMNKPQDFLHLAVLYWPLICLVIVYARAGLHGRMVATCVTLAVLAIPTATVVWYSGRMLSKFLESHTTLVEGERAGFYALPAEAAMLHDVVAYIQENSAPGDRVGAMPYFPIVNFLAERDGPHRSAYIVWPFPELPDRDQRIIDGIEETHTNLIIWNFTQFFSINPVWEHAPVLFEYLVDHFEIDRVFSHDEWGYKLAGLTRSDPALASRGERIVPEDGEGVAITVVGGGPPRPVPPEARSVYLQEMLWPFRRVLALRASTGGRSTVMSVPLRVPDDGARLRTAVAVHPQWWFKLPPSWVEFRLVLRDEAGDVQPLFAQKLNPTLRLADRGWFDVDVSLDAWAGQAVTVEFINEAERPTGETLWMGGWSIPLLEPTLRARVRVVE